MPSYEISLSVALFRTLYVVMLAFSSLRRATNAFVIPSAKNHIKSSLSKHHPTFRLFSVATTSTDSNTAKTGYPFADVESKWQAYWEENQTITTLESIATPIQQVQFPSVTVSLLDYFF